MRWQRDKLLKRLMYKKASLRLISVDKKFTKKHDTYSSQTIDDYENNLNFHFDNRLAFKIARSIDTYPYSVTYFIQFKDDEIHINSRRDQELLTYDLKYFNYYKLMNTI